MHMLHFQLCTSLDPEQLTSCIKTQDFYYRGPTCFIKPYELAVCLPCANNCPEHIQVNQNECELSTMEGWMSPNELQSVAAYVLDNQSEKIFILETGQSLFRLLNIAMIHKAIHTKCRINPIFCFEYVNEHHDEDELMDYDDNDDNINDGDSGIFGDVNCNMVYIALESLD
jgi:hypothetical protein